ncbi:MAG: hypothetical protein ACUVQG_11050 [Thermogutta sp.]
MIESLDVASLPPLPAPIWFVQFFKVLGFVLHMIPMNLWLVGMLLTVILYRWEGYPRRWATRLGRQMPVIVAFGVNLGIVPLLFIQVAYPWAFYPATILTAWFWLAIIGLLLLAYYGVYIFTFGISDETATVPIWRFAAGWIAALLFVILAVLFSNGMSLMAASERWKAIWTAHQIAGAATGTGHNFGDASLWHRWSMVLGMALMTTAVWSLVDASFFDRRGTSEYRRWLAQFCLVIGIIGAVVYAGAGTGYVFGNWPQNVFSYMWSGWRLPLTLLTGASPALVVLALLWTKIHGISRGNALVASLAQLIVLATNAVSRQLVQNLELTPLVSISQLTAKPDWGPMAMFLVSFGVGVVIVGWMLRQVLQAERSA